MAKWVLAVLWVMAATDFLLSVATDLPPDVTYIKEETYGDFFMSKGTMVHKDNIEGSFTGCFSMCWDFCKRQSSCQAVVAVRIPESDSFNCEFTSLSPLDSTLLSNADATYFYKPDSVPSTVYKLMEDNIVYLVPNEEMDFESAKDFCSRLPGHRLGIFKTLKQIEIIQGLRVLAGAAIWVDLISNGDGDASWGDGTTYNEIGLPQEFIYLDGNPGDPLRFTTKFDDRVKTSLFKLVCQVDP